MEIKIKNDPYIQEFSDAIFSPVALAIAKIPLHSKLDSLEANRIHFAETSTKNSFRP